MTDEKREKIDALKNSISELDRLRDKTTEANTHYTKAVNDFLDMVGKNPSGWVFRTGRKGRDQTEVPMSKELAATLKPLMEIGPVEMGGFEGVGCGGTWNGSCFCVVMSHPNYDVSACICYRQ